MKLCGKCSRPSIWAPTEHIQTRNTTISTIGNINQAHRKWNLISESATKQEYVGCIYRYKKKYQSALSLLAWSQRKRMQRRLKWIVLKTSIAQSYKEITNISNSRCSPQEIQATNKRMKWQIFGFFFPKREKTGHLALNTPFFPFGSTRAVFGVSGVISLLLLLFLFVFCVFLILYYLHIMWTNMLLYWLLVCYSLLVYLSFVVVLCFFLQMLLWHCIFSTLHFFCFFKLFQSVQRAHVYQYFIILIIRKGVTALCFSRAICCLFLCV